MKKGTRKPTKVKVQAPYERGDGKTRYPKNKLSEAVMRVLACAGLDLLVADGDTDDKEIKTLVVLLQKYFTDNPKSEMVTDLQERATRLENSISIINKEGNERKKKYIVSRLVELALADGLYEREERGVIRDIEKKLKLGSNGEDDQMRHIIQEIKESLQKEIRDKIDCWMGGG